MKKLDINFKTSYPIYIGKGCLKRAVFIDYFAVLKKRWVIVHDDNDFVTNIANDIRNNLQDNLNSNVGSFSVEVFSFPSGENHKTRETKQQLEDQLLDKKFGRDTCLIAVGGGVACDLVGFLASTYCRGVDCIYIPTTLLAMVDASIGGKTGVNTPQGKNLIGTFHQPQAVFMDMDTLKTLPEREWRGGLVELIKHALIADSTLFEQLKNFGQVWFVSSNVLSVTADAGINDVNSVDNERALTDLIYQSCCIKKSIVEQDEKEQGLRQLLNYGHTIGHAMEQIEQYAISHGEAVAIGILVESYLSVRLGFLPQADFQVIEDLLKAYQLPLKTKAFADKKLFLDVLTRDKKSKAGEVYFVLLNKIGQARMIKQSEQKTYSFCVDSELLNEALNWAAKKFSPLPRCHSLENGNPV